MRFEGTIELDGNSAGDTPPREISVPSDLAAALDRHPAARRNFDALSYRGKRWFVVTIEQVEQAETRRRRVKKAVAALS